MDTAEKWASSHFLKFISDHWLNVLGIIIVTALAYYVGSRVVTFVVTRTIKTARHREWHRKDIEKRQKTLAHLFGNIWHIMVIFAFSYAMLKEFFPHIGSMLAPLFASAGIIGIALGFGAQSLIKDFLSGIFIISENQYRVGDTVDIEGFSGTVELIGTRSTVLRDVDGNVHYFPNGMVQHVINKTMGYSMSRFTLLVRPTSDVDEVADLVDKTGMKLAEEEKWKDKIIQAPKFVSVGDITGNATEIIVAGKTQPSDQWAVTAEMRRRLHEAFDDHGIKLAIAPQLLASKKNK